MPARRGARRALLAGPPPAPPGPHGPRGSTYIIRASELGAWAFCERSWWLRFIAGAAPSAGAQVRLDAGHLRHAEHGRRVEWAAVLWKIGLACVALAGLLALLLLFAALAH